jgi:hypothetical protein
VLSFEFFLFSQNPTKVVKSCRTWQAHCFITALVVRRHYVLKCTKLRLYGNLSFCDCFFFQILTLISHQTLYYILPSILKVSCSMIWACLIVKFVCVDDLDRYFPNLPFNTCRKASGRTCEFEPCIKYFLEVIPFNDFGSRFQPLIIGFGLRTFPYV